MTASITSRVQIPPGLAIAPQLPDLMLPAKIRRGVFGFLRNNPTVAIGGALLLILILIGILSWYGTRSWEGWEYILDIVGKGVADIGAYEAAIRLAARIASRKAATRSQAA